MCDDKKLQFTCRECGTHELGYQKYTKCMTPVSLQGNGHTEYGSSVIDETDYLCDDEGFVCLNCQAPLEHAGYLIKTEKELIDYLTMDPQVREEKEQASMSATMES